MSRAAKLLEARGLDLELLDRLGIRPWADPAGGVVTARAQRGLKNDDWIEIEFRVKGRVVRTKYRTLGEPKDFWQGTGPKVGFWNGDILDDESLAKEPLIITEGELDAPAAIMAGYPRTVAHPNGCPAPARRSGSSRRGSSSSRAR